MILEIQITDEEYELFCAAAALAKLPVADWAHACLVADARANERRSPRRDPGAQDRQTTAIMVACGHCGIETRAVARCDNCDARLQ